MRSYPFDLPLTIPGWQILMGKGEIKKLPSYNEIPDDLRQRLDEADGWKDVVITKEELDRIPDDAWQEIAQLLQVL